MKLVKKYYLEFLAFATVLAVLMIDLNPDFTFINKAADSIGYIYSAQYLYPSYHTSPPLYLLTSHLFLMLPFGTEAWRMGLLSVLSTMGACVFIFFIIRHHLPNQKFYPILGVLLYGLSALVISQSVIVNTYATTCMLASGAYYFAITQRWKLMGLMLGIGLAVHLLMAFVFGVLFIFYRSYRRNWKALVVTFSFILFYAYIPLTNRPPYMWLPDPSTVNTLWATVTDTLSTINMLIGSLAIWDLPKRILDIIGMMGVSIGVITIIPLIVYFRKARFWRDPLLWLILVPILLFMGELDMNTYDYTMIAMPFLSVAICLGLHKMMVEQEHDSFLKLICLGVTQVNKAKVFRIVVLIVVVGLGAFNCYFFNIGTTLDSNLGATKLYREEFNKLPDKAIFMPNYAWEWEAIYKYNRDNDKSIYPICIDILPSELYRKQLAKDGVNFTESNDENISIKASEIAKSIALLNDNVWTTVSLEPRTFTSEVVKANPTNVANVDKERIAQITNNPPIQWKPYNPYHIITSELFITHWSYILYSNWNIRLFASLAGLGIILNWLIWYLPSRNKRKEVSDES